MSRNQSLRFFPSVMPTSENRIFELSATYLEFIISTETMTPVELGEEEMTTFR